MTTALIYAALERNTGAVGQTSDVCTKLPATNPQIAAISQHHKITLKSVSFAPGTVGSTTDLAQQHLTGMTFRSVIQRQRATLAILKMTQSVVFSPGIFLSKMKLRLRSV